LISQSARVLANHRSSGALRVERLHAIAQTIWPSAGG
jgi:hypothetical protein